MKKTHTFLKVLILISLISINFSYILNIPHKIYLKIVPIDYKVIINNKEVKIYKYKDNINYCFAYKENVRIKLVSQNYYTKIIYHNFNKKYSTFIETKLFKKNKFIDFYKQIETGKQPKSVEYSPSGKYILSALLNDNGIDVFDGKSFKYIKRLSPPRKYQNEKGFVEIAFINSINEIWVTQMHSGLIHIFDLQKLNYKKTIKLKGKGCKIIITDRNEKYAYVSNWFSSTIEIIDIKKHKSIDQININGIPRGMIISNNNKYLYSCNFKTGAIEKINLQTRKIIKNVIKGPGCKRHIVIDRKSNTLYCSDMGSGKVYIIDEKTDKLIKTIYVGKKLNTIKLSNDGKYLFISSRGPNNPYKGYLFKGLIYGKIFIIDTKLQKVVDWVWGKNQPTGLDLSPTNKFLIYTNFLDHNIEIYKIKRYYYNQRILLY